MESSAVVYCNSVLGARTNTEGRESTSAAMITGKIPDWGFHRDEYRFATHRIDVEVPVESLMDWGMLGYFVGDVVGERIPVLVGQYGKPDLIRHKHFGAAAASSGGVEMYHIVGVTPEAPTLAAALGPNTPVETFRYGKAEQRRTYETLNARGKRSERGLRDARLSACRARADPGDLPAARGQEDQRERAALGVHLARRARECREAQGYSKIIRDAGGVRDHGHLLGHRPGAAAGHEGRCARFGEAGALPAGDHGHPGVVRLDGGLHQRRAHRPMEWSGAMSTRNVITLHGRKVVGGVAEGEALVTRDTISGWGGVNPMHGTIIETRHELRGVSFKDKVLVCPGAKGSSGWSAVFHTCRLAGTAPKAMIFNEMTTKIALGVRGDARAFDHRARSRSARAHRDRRLGEGRRRSRRRRDSQGRRASRGDRVKFAQRRAMPDPAVWSAGSLRECG